MRVGINGMGRIGRLALRAAMGAAERQSDDPRAGNRLEVVHINELKGGAAATAHLLQFDTVQGRWREAIEANAAGDAIQIKGRDLRFTSGADRRAVRADRGAAPKRARIAADGANLAPIEACKLGFCVARA